MYKLLIEDDEGGKTAVSLIRDEITIGRKEGNTIRLTERNVSRRHGRILRQNDRIYVEDVAARYGIKKNGKKIDERAELKEGDVVLIGDYRLTLQVDAKAKKQKDKALPRPKARAPGKSDPGEATKITSLDEISGGRDFGEGVRESTQIMQTLPAKLVVISSNFAGEEFPLRHEEMVIGRGDDCHIIIDHRSISTKHAKIVREDNTTYKIVDLNSKNGVKVSGDTYRATHLKRGDVVELGHVKFRFVEPGENYVFTPQAESHSPSPAAMSVATGSSSGPNKTVVMVGAVLVAALLAVGAFFLMAGNGEDDPVNVDTSETALAAQELEDMNLEDGDDVVGAGIERARAQIAEGRLQRAMGTLEMVQDMDPTSEQQGTIDELLAQARTETPFLTIYESVLSDVEGQQFMEALDRVTSIPSHSIFYERLEQDGVFEEIFAGVLASGYQALDEHEFDRARSIADEVLMVRSDYRAAEQLIAEVESAEEEQARVLAAQQAEREERRIAAANNRTNTPTERAPRLSAEEARQLFTQAARKVARGDNQGAITDCNRAVASGNTDCHRILGLAYSNLNQTSQACRHFQLYLNTGPSNPGVAQSQMDRLGCGP